MITSDVDNYPGFREGILGPELMGQMRAQAERFGTEFITDDVTHVDFSETPHKVYIGEREYRARAVIVATGATARQLGLPGERALQGRGGQLLRRLRCRVLPRPARRGGRAEATRRWRRRRSCAKFASEVVLVHRRDEFRASRVMVDAARATENLRILTPYTVEDVLGVEENRVTGVQAAATSITGEERSRAGRRVLRRDRPRPEHRRLPRLARARRERLPDHRADSTRTKVEGVFAAGDVQDHIYRQAVTAAGSGCMAALDAERWLTARARDAVAAG